MLGCFCRHDVNHQNTLVFLVEFGLWIILKLLWNLCSEHPVPKRTLCYGMLFAGKDMSLPSLVTDNALSIDCLEGHTATTPSQLCALPWKIHGYGIVWHCKGMPVKGQGPGLAVFLGFRGRHCLASLTLLCDNVCSTTTTSPHSITKRSRNNTAPLL
jgi:hypothetical protein